MFTFGAKPATTSTTIPGSTLGGSSLFGSSTPATTQPSSIGFGFGTTPSSAPTIAAAAPVGGLAIGTSATPSAAVSSFSAHPFQYIQQCYDQSNLNYRFRTYFYNRVEGGVVKYPTAKPANISDRLWTQITNDNPDPSNYIPIIANGFDDLKSRAAWQDEQMEAQAAKLKELEERLAVLLKKTDLETSSQLQQIHKQQLQLVKRTVNIMKMFEVAKRAGHRLQPNEEALKLQIQSLYQKLSTQPPLEPNSMRSIQFQIQALQEVDRLDALQPLRHLQFEDESSMESILGLLSDQHKGIKALSETLIKDAKDLELMHYGFQL